VWERRDQDMGEVGDGRKDAPLDVPIEMATVGTPNAMETEGATIPQKMERNDHGQWRWGSEAVGSTVATSDWRSCMEKTIRQQAQELIQLHRTVGHLVNLCEARETRQEAQW
jgi:hypothetical protein